MIKLGFVGAGKIGTCLAYLLNRKEKYSVVAVYDIVVGAAKTFAKAVGNCHVAASEQEVADMADVVFITIIDDHIAPVCSRIKWRKGQSVIHCSGANSSELLESAKKQGAYVGVFHPGFMLVDVSIKTAKDHLSGATFDIEAEEPLLSTLKEMAMALDCRWVEVGPKERPVFHVADEFASMYVLLLIKIGTELMKAINIPVDRGIRALLPMLKVTVSQIENLGISQNLPGPVARYDIGTIKKHLNGLQEIAPTAVSLYRELALQSIPVVLAQGSINKQQADEIKKLLK